MEQAEFPTESNKGRQIADIRIPEFMDGSLSANSSYESLARPLQDNHALS